MTRGTVPRFDLYEELEVSRLASVEVIEAAYRSLAKQHHPDVLPSSDGERIKRLNLAREWLVDPVKRRRYDEWTGSRWRISRPADGPARGSARASSETSFGVNTPAVRQFLSDLRALDRPRARQIWDGRAVAHARGYSGARRRALAASKGERENEWRFAREAASVITRGKLGDSTLTAQVIDVVADIAGTITVSDLLTRADFDVLMLPWMWRRQPSSVSSSADDVAAVPRAGPQATVAGSREPRATDGAAGASRAVPFPTAAASPPFEAVPPPFEAVRSPGPVPSPSGAVPGRAPELTRASMRPGFAEPIAPESVAARVRRSQLLARAGSLPLLYVVVAVMGIGGAIAAINRPPPATAIDPGPPTAVPTQLVAGVTAAPTLVETPPPPATPDVPAPIDPALVRELQRGAAKAIRELTAAAAIGDVATAKELLGGTAPGLQSTGLQAAAFPEIRAAEITISRDAAGWTAIAESDRLASADGSTWTFDYGDRPLARFLGAGARQLFWSASDGQHDLYLRTPSATLSRSGLSVRFAWDYPPGAVDDPFFDRARIVVTTVVLDAAALELTTEPSATIRIGEKNATVLVPDSIKPTGRIEIHVTVSPRIGGGGSIGGISTSFGLEPG